MRGGEDFNAVCPIYVLSDTSPEGGLPEVFPKRRHPPGIPLSTGNISKRYEILRAGLHTPHDKKKVTG